MYYQLDHIELDEVKQLVHENDGKVWQYLSFSSLVQKDKESCCCHFYHNVFKYWDT